jgi:hypothetical protein
LPWDQEEEERRRPSSPKISSKQPKLPSSKETQRSPREEKEKEERKRKRREGEGATYSKP